ncbi:hypothetical protein [Singulisphaera sp. PoT]|uniref:hypothetical protein n=1 Tax=Singulisphaera sp. PoT TaxID=3411797 RepID=UPI003BF5E973
MRSPSARLRTGTVDLYRYRPDFDADSGAVADISSLIAKGVACSVQPISVEQVTQNKRTTQVTKYDLWFFDDHQLAIKDLVVWVDAAGVSHNLFVFGQLPQIGSGLVLKVTAQEVR